MSENEEQQPAETPAESSAETSAPPAESSASKEKKKRNPVEKMLVWGVIAVGLIVVAIEARAKLGYDMTLSGLTKRLEEIDAAEGDSLSMDMDGVKSYLKFGPKLHEVEEDGNLKKARWIEWYSLAKPDAYRLKLIFDEDGTFLFVETTDPPEPPAPEPSEDDEDGDIDGGMPGGPGGGGPGAGGPPSGAMAGGEGGGQGAEGGRRGGGRRNGLLGLLGIDEVMTELNLTDDQISKVEAFAETIQAEMSSSGMREIFGQMREATDEEREKLREQIQSLRNEIEQKVAAGLADMLDEEQLNRLMQIEWQRQGTAALATDAVAVKLELTEEQQKKLAELNESRQSEMRELGFQASPEERQTVTDKYDAEFLAVLTDDQKALWVELQGADFDLPEPQRGGGGRGGDGGGERPERPQRPEAE
ncbi:MAG: hypothetical protein HUJ26_12200 [Planctomycetaceae bacterium]|nr:hypothetical protein [Planctomycetaceae bacterium]